MIAGRRPLARIASGLCAWATAVLLTVSGAAAQEAQNPNPWAHLTLEALEATRAAPLFTPSRRPPPVVVARPDPGADAVEAGAPPPPLQLVGTVMTGGEQMALLLDTNTRAVHRLRPGESVDGWSVDIVDGRTVTLRSGEELHILTMFDEFGPPVFGSLPDAAGFDPFGPFGGPPVIEDTDLE